MKCKPIFASVLAGFVTAGIRIASVQAQDTVPSVPVAPVLGLEYSSTVSEPPPVPKSAGASKLGTAQSVVPSSQGVLRNSALARLVNPFDGQTLPAPGSTQVYNTPGPVASAQGERIPLVNPFDGGTIQAPRDLPNLPSEQRVQAPVPSTQTSGLGFPGGRKALSQIYNPFDDGYGQSPRGLLEQASPRQVSPQPQTGSSMASSSAVGAADRGGAGTSIGAEGVTGGNMGSPSGSSTAALSSNAPMTANIPGGEGTSAAAGFGGTLETGSTPFAMIGDIAPFSSVPGPPTPPGARGASPIYPSVRNFKISENQSPRPQDRVFFDFNFYNNLNDSINLRDLSPITQMKAYVYNFGIEKTFNNGMGSVGIRVPLDNLTANSFGNIVSTPTSSAMGNLTIFGKYILGQNTQTGSLVSACWAISPQTGPGRFAGAPYLFPLNSTYFQTCIAYIYNYKKWYLQGFSGMSFPANSNDTTMVYNDVALGYFVFRNQDSNAWLTALAPTVELHVNNPLNHRDPFNRFDLAGSTDTVDFTFGLNFGIRNTAVLTVAFATPVSSPKPFDSEAILMLNIFYGRSRRTVPITPPPL